MPAVRPRAPAPRCSAALADRLGLTDALTKALCVHSRKVTREPGRIVRDLAVMLADGGDALTDLGVLRDQEALRLWPRTPPPTAAWNGSTRTRSPACARPPRRRPLVRLAQATTPRRLIPDIDATLITARLGEGGRTGTLLRAGFGFHLALL